MAEDTKSNPTILAKLRNSIWGSLFSLNMMFQSVIPSIGTPQPLQDINKLRTYEGVSPDDSNIYTGALNIDERPLVLESYDGCKRDENGTLVITYTFDHISTLNSLSNEDGLFNSLHRGQKDFVFFTEDQKKLAKEILHDEVPHIANIRFEEAKNPEDAYLTLISADLTEYDAGAYANNPSGIGGNIVMGKAFRNDKAWQVTFRHELGHSLGMRHGHEVRGDGPNLPADANDQNMTIMSYDGSDQNSRSGAITNDGTDKIAQTFQWLDQHWLIENYGESKLISKDRNQELD